MFATSGRLPRGCSAAVLALLLVSWACAMPLAASAREDMSAGECGDPGDGTGLTSTGGSSFGDQPGSTADHPSGHMSGARPAPLVLLIPVPMPNGVTFIVVVELPSLRGGGQ